MYQKSEPEPHFLGRRMSCKIMKCLFCLFRLRIPVKTSCNALRLTANSTLGIQTKGPNLFTRECLCKNREPVIKVDGYRQLSVTADGLEAN